MSFVVDAGAAATGLIPPSEAAAVDVAEVTGGRSSRAGKKSSTDSLRVRGIFGETVDRVCVGKSAVVVAVAQGLLGTST